jgi:endonuclease/exonuclease/phosphatase family metal-dependent hydrolase
LYTKITWVRIINKTGNLKFLKLSKKDIFPKRKGKGVLAAVVIIVFLMAVYSVCCTADKDLPNTGSPGSFTSKYLIKNPDIGECLKSVKEGVLKILDQNTMLIPFWPVAPAYLQRTFCIIELISKGYDILGLQEVFAGSSQDRIVSAWHDMIYRDMEDGQVTGWQYDYYNEWYDYIQSSGGKMWQSLDNALDVENLAEEENFWGVRVIDCKPNDKDAKIVCSPYYVMGPDSGWLPLQQDGGLVILSRYPITACSAFTFKTSSGTDRLAGKGVLYARIQIGPQEGDYIHVFNTHLQSHDYPETRREHIEELLNFVSMIIGSEEGGRRPVIIMGDFNIASDVPEDWMEISNIISPPDEYSAEDDPEMMTLPSEEYGEFCDRIKDFEENDPEGKLYLDDLWLKLRPDDPGFTWIGGDWTTGDKNSYGSLGNRIAIEKGGPQRIDYIFYFGGFGSVNIEPKTIDLVPDEPEVLYCYDRELYRNPLSSGNGCITVGKEGECFFKSYTVSDHLGLEAYFDFMIK